MRMTGIKNRNLAYTAGVASYCSQRASNLWQWETRCWRRSAHAPPPGPAPPDSARTGRPRHATLDCAPLRHSDRKPAGRPVHPGPDVLHGLRHERRDACSTVQLQGTHAPSLLGDGRGLVERIQGQRDVDLLKGQEMVAHIAEGLQPHRLRQLDKLARIRSRTAPDGHRMGVVLRDDRQRNEAGDSQRNAGRGDDGYAISVAMSMVRQRPAQRGEGGRQPRPAHPHPPQPHADGAAVVTDSGLATGSNQAAIFSRAGTPPE